MLSELELPRVLFLCSVVHFACWENAVLDYVPGVYLPNATMLP